MINFFKLLLFSGLFTGVNIPIGELEIRSYDLVIVLCGLYFLATSWKIKSVSLLTFLLYLSFALLYLKTSMFVTTIAPPIVALRYLEGLIVLMVIPHLIMSMSPLDIRRALIVAAILNFIWIMVQVVNGFKFGLYGYSSFGYFGAAFASSTVMATLLVLLAASIDGLDAKLKKILMVLLFLGLLIGTLGVGSRTAVLAASLTLIFLWIFGLKTKLTYTRLFFTFILMVSVSFIVGYLQAIDFFTGTLDDNSIFERFGKIGAAFEFRYSNRPMPVGFLDTLMGTPEALDFVGYNGVGFTIDSTWMAVIKNFGLLFSLPMIVCLLSFSIKHQLIIPTVFTLIVAFGIDILSTLHVLVMVTIMYVSLLKLREL